MKYKTKSKLTPERRKQIIKDGLIFCIIIIASFSFMPVMGVALKTEYPMVIVISPSMEPNIMTGDLLIISYKNPADIVNGTVEDKTGDVILYDCHDLGWEKYMPVYEIPNEPIVHRVVGKYFNETDQQYYFFTCGDNNSGNIDPPDWNNGEIPIPEDHILGVVIGKVPKIGMIKMWFSDPDNNALSTLIISGISILLVISIVQEILHPEEEKKKENKEKDNKDFKMDIAEEKVEQTNNEINRQNFDLGI